MKVKNTFPIISDIIVVIKDVKYKDTLCTMDVFCSFSHHKDGKPVFRVNKAECEDPFCIMGISFWKDRLGTRQTNRIKKLCDQAIKDYLEKEDLR